MRKETTIAAGAVAAVVLGVSGWLLIASPSDKSGGASGDVIELDLTEEPAVVPALDDELPGRPVPEYYDDTAEPEEVTRIIIATPDSEEISDLLSEKVIVNDEVVDQK